MLYSKQIGAHDLVVVKAESSKDLENWAKKNLNFTISYDIFERYINKGYKYFVFDKIRVDSEVRTVEPLIYVFESDVAYYPLVITTETTRKPSGVSLFLVIPGIPLDHVALSKLPTVFFGGNELRNVHEKLYEMFPNGAYVTYYEDYGMYSSDFIVKRYYIPTFLDKASEWLNERLFVKVLRQYFFGSWWRISDPIGLVISLGIVLLSLAGMAVYGYVIYLVAKGRGKVLGVLGIVAFYALAVCVDVFGLFVLATSLPLGVSAFVLVVIEVRERLKNHKIR